MAVTTQPRPGATGDDAGTTSTPGAGRAAGGDRIDPVVVARGAALVVGIVVPVSLVVRALGDRVDLALLVVVTVLVASAGGGVVASRAARHRPLVHATLAGVAANVVLTVFALVRLALTSSFELRHAVFLLLLFQIMVALALLGGEAARRFARRGSSASTEEEVG